MLPLSLHTWTGCITQSSPDKQRQWMSECVRVASLSRRSVYCMACVCVDLDSICSTPVVNTLRSKKCHLLIIMLSWKIMFYPPLVAKTVPVFPSWRLDFEPLQLLSPSLSTFSLNMCDVPTKTHGLLLFKLHRSKTLKVVTKCDPALVSKIASLLNERQNRLCPDCINVSLPYPSWTYSALCEL